MSISQFHFTRRSRRLVTGAAVAVTLGGALAGCGSSRTAATTTSAASGAATTGAATSTRAMPPGFGKAVTGAAAAKAKAAALAKYPGTVEQVMQLPGGSYVVHVIRKSGGEVHVMVSKAFSVTGTQSGPPAGAAPSGNRTPPAGGPPSGGAPAAPSGPTTES